MTLADYQFDLAVYREVLRHTSITTLLGTSTTWTTWLWRWKPYVELKNSGACAIVISIRSGLSANAHNTARFPRIQFEVFADVDRTLGKPTGRFAEEKCLHVCEEVDKVFHVPQGGVILWGDGSAGGSMRIAGSLREVDPEPADVPDGDGLVRALAMYQVSLG